MNRAHTNKTHPGNGLPRYAAFVVVFMVLIIVEGAIVRATGSGNGCGAHWPLCNNQIIPHHPRIATIIEFTHRSLTGVCTALVAALLVWTFLARPRGHRARTAVIWTAILLLTEGALGALLVLGGYVERNASNARVLVQWVHFTNTLLLLAAMTMTWRFLSAGSPREASLLPKPPAKLVWFTLAVTLVAGAAGSIAALADTIFPSPSLRAGLAEDFSKSAPLLIRMRWIHPATALCALILVVVLAMRMGDRRRSEILLALATAQLLLGVADVLLLAPIALQALHLLFADLLWIALVTLGADILMEKSPEFAGTHGTSDQARPC